MCFIFVTKLAAPSSSEPVETVDTSDTGVDVLLRSTATEEAREADLLRGEETETLEEAL